MSVHGIAIQMMNYILNNDITFRKDDFNVRKKHYFLNVGCPWDNQITVLNFKGAHWVDIIYFVTSKFEGNH